MNIKRKENNSVFSPAFSTQVAVLGSYIALRRVNERIQKYLSRAAHRIFQPAINLRGYVRYRYQAKCARGLLRSFVPAESTTCLYMIQKL